MGAFLFYVQLGKMSLPKHILQFIVQRIYKDTNFILQITYKAKNRVYMFCHIAVLVNGVKNEITFGRALNKKEMRQYIDVQEKARKLAGQTGKSIFIVHDACLPQSDNKNTGVSNLASNESIDFLSYMKSYLGFNTVEILPCGELHSNNGLYSPYSGTSLSLGNHEINLELLTQNEFEKILSPDEYKDVVNSNTASDKKEIVNHKNVVEEWSAHENALKKAYARFKNLDEKTELKKNFKAYTKENNDWLEPKTVYKILSKKYNTDDYVYWQGIDSYLYEPVVSNEERSSRIAQILKENPDEAEYYKFKQFIADEHLSYGKKKLHKIGLKLTGDCEINFSKDEIWANPEAFKKDSFIGEKNWHILSLNYDIIKNPNSASAKLLKRKVELCAKRYDSIRFDVGWAYIKPKIHHSTGGYEIKYLGDSVVNLIEETVKKVKGKDYDLNNLIYEFQGGEIFKSRYQNGICIKTGDLLDEVKSRVGVYDTVFMHDTYYDTWGSNDGFLKRGWPKDKFIVGVSNHDSQPLRQIANNVCDTAIIGNDKYHKEPAIEPLAKILKLNPESLQNPVEFAKAKWAEPMMAENNMMFYMDVFGREERFNMHHLNTIEHPEKNFAYKIPANYKEAYHRALQEGYGFNIMDSFEKIFKAKGLDKTEPKLYKKIVKFRDILYENDTAASSKNSLKNNKYIKPLLIIGAAICAAAFIIKHIISSNKKTANSAIDKTVQNNTANKPILNKNIQNKTIPDINDFLNSTKINS